MTVRMQENVSCATELAFAKASCTSLAFLLNQIPYVRLTIATNGTMLKAQAPKVGLRINMYDVIPVIRTTDSMLEEIKKDKCEMVRCLRHGIHWSPRKIVPKPEEPGKI